ncbi:MAG: UbiA family prenyltransferase [Caldilineaceae bacterium]|nr:UbiA family prenyltransferase [Caldilineaceae bacterium]
MSKVWLPGVGQLVVNHIDAWSVTGFVGAVALLAHHQFTFPNLLLLLALMVGYWQAFVLNDYFDAPFDQATPQKARYNFFVQQPQQGRALLRLLVPVNLGITWAFLQYGWRGLGILLLCFGIMWAYSAPPLRIKGRPGWDLLIHGLFVETFPYWVCLYLPGISWEIFDYVLLSFLLLASLTAQLEQQLRDFDMDRRYARTFATVLGRRPTAALLQIGTALLIGVGITATSVGIIPWRFAPFGLIGLPVMLHRFFRPVTRGRPLWLSWLALSVAAFYLGWLLLNG